MRVLVVNAGSSSLKLAVVDPDDQVLASESATSDDGPAGATLRRLVGDHGPVDAVGHRVVHGGSRHLRPVLVDDAVLADLRAATPLAPLHQPGALAGLAAAADVLPHVPAVACFDTTFHADLPVGAAVYAVPPEWRERFGLRRFGAHGLSYAWAARHLDALTGGRARRLVVAHLGSGASVCAVLEGRSVDTTMGLTPMEGLVMATRSGTVDPGLVLWLLTEGGLTVEEVTEGLDRRGGLLALAGTADLREVLELADRGDERAGEALEAYVHRVAAAVAAMTASLGGLDVLAFTGGAGEAAAAVRSAVAGRLGHLGVAVDTAANEAAEPDCEVSAPGATARTWVVRAREELEIARSVREVVTSIT